MLQHKIVLQAYICDQDRFVILAESQGDYIICTDYNFDTGTWGNGDYFPKAANNNPFLTALTAYTEFLNKHISVLWTGNYQPKL